MLHFGQIAALASQESGGVATLIAWRERVPDAAVVGQDVLPALAEMPTLDVERPERELVDEIGDPLNEVVLTPVSDPIPGGDQGVVIGELTGGAANTRR